jgi:hypothetical protein
MQPNFHLDESEDVDKGIEDQIYGGSGSISSRSLY